MDLSPAAKKIRAHLIALGYEADELDATCPDEASLHAMKKAMDDAGKVEAPEDAESPEPADTYVPPAYLEKDAVKRRKDTANAEAQARYDAAPKPAHAPTFDEVLKSMEDGFSADDSNVPNN